MHMSAEFACTSDVNCTIKSSFFFDPQKCPPTFDPGEIVRLVGVEVQDWNGLAQLSGKNVSIVCLSNKSPTI
jgi:hypothetical protein